MKIFDNARLCVAAIALAALSAAAAVPAGGQTAAAPAATAPANDDIRVTPVVLAYRKSSPAIVNISTETLVTERMGFPDNWLDMFDEAFPAPMLRKVPVHSLGSGTIIHPAGYIVTNAHVVVRAQKIDVTMSDGTKHSARMVALEPAHDLAILKMEPPKDAALPHLPLGRSDDLMVGETVIAVGNPMGLAGTLTTGVISATDRTIEFSRGAKYTGLIQTSAPINPGNSGGPLLNIKGQLVGITTAIRADAQNIGFAIPIDTIAANFCRLLDFEKINRVVFGATISQRHGRFGDEIFVSAIRPGTPAEGKLAPGDLLTAVNDVAMTQIPQFACEMFSLGGQAKAIKCRIVRGGKEQTVEVAMQAKPPPDGKELGEKLLGMTLKKVTPQVAREMGLPISSGLVAVALAEDGPAVKIGMRKKDVLFRLAGVDVKDLDELGMVLEELEAGETVQIGIVRGQTAAIVQIKLAGLPAEKPASTKPTEKKK
ncbi:MAG: trypsin-like peptidase domain-containing protein [Planctomycetes bacterium]|nr:trypsin-like peptidase domain-containing protein [Planctomycetota bacterium]